MSSAAFMLNAQHIPRSVGNVVKIAEQGIASPFHSQCLSNDFSPSPFEVKFLTSKHGKVEYHRDENRAGRPVVNFINIL